MFGDAHLPEAFDALRRLLIDVARARTVDALPEQVVSALARAPEVAWCQVWLADREAAPDRERMAEGRGELGLVASGGADTGASWRVLDAELQRLDAAHPTLGVLLSQRAGVRIAVPRRLRGGADPRLVERRVRGVLAHPLVGRAQVIGALAIYVRRPVDDAAVETAQIIAEQLAAGVANARAFAEVDRLRRTLELENAYLKEEVDDARAWGGLVGRSPALARVVERIDLVAPTDATVLVLGESGTGKEVVAREIHRRSQRAGRPLIRVNCASIPRELFESEFFGHVRGAFTGASRDRLGRFAAADGGTLFLDEVGEIPLELQGKLLRVLQEGQYERVGEEQTRTVDVRIIAATNRDLRAQVDAGRFRGDLYYRLDVFPIAIAPLRERMDDVEPLARHFVERACQRFNVARPELRQAALATLQAYPWPGNVRELQNVVERAVIGARGGRLRFDLPHAAPNAALATAAATSPSPQSGRPQAGPRPAATPVLTDAEMQARVKTNIERALAVCGGRIYGPDGAAALLGLKPTTLASRLKALGIGRGGSAR